MRVMNAQYYAGNGINGFNRVISITLALLPAVPTGGMTWLDRISYLLHLCACWTEHSMYPIVLGI